MCTLGGWARDAFMAADMGFTWRYVGEFGDEIYVRARISIYMGSMWATDSCFEMDMRYIWGRWGMNEIK